MNILLIASHLDASQVAFAKALRGANHTVVLVVAYRENEVQGLALARRLLTIDTLAADGQQAAETFQLFEARLASGVDASFLKGQTPISDDDESAARFARAAAGFVAAKQQTFDRVQVLGLATLQDTLRQSPFCTQVVAAGDTRGVDYNMWNPATDTNLSQRYDASENSVRFSKAANKADLQHALSLPQANVPLILISNAVANTYSEAFARLLLQNVQLVVDGDALANLDATWRDRLAHANQVSMHKLLAGADVVVCSPEDADFDTFAAMRYGTLPLLVGAAPARGVELDFDCRSGTTVFSETNHEAVYAACLRSVAACHDRDGLARTRARLMRQDHSWDRVAKSFSAASAASATT